MLTENKRTKIKSMLTLLMVKTLGTHRVQVKTAYFHNKTSQHLHETGVKTFIYPLITIVGCLTQLLID